MQLLDYVSISPSGSDLHWKVPSNTAPRLILSASQGRAHGSIFNDSTATLYLKFGSNSGMATSGSSGIYDLKLGSSSLYELPKPVWVGEIWGAWDVDLAAGSARVLELGKSGGGV